jgi:hypothetical protein
MATPPAQERTDGAPGRDVARMDDFEVIRERQRVMTALATLTSRYRQLNHEMYARKTLKWMVEP